MNTICFDLDGTLFDLYGKSNWLEMLRTEKPEVFRGDFLPEIDVTKLFLIMARLAAAGARFEVITWLPKYASKEFERACTREKIRWVKNNLPFIDNISCISYGVPKQTAISKRTSKIFLIDDSEEVGRMWETKTQRKWIKVNKKFTVVDALAEIYKEIEEG